MAFNINDLTQYFDNPALSKFSRKTKKGFTTQLGQMIPTNWDFLNFGNSIKGTSYHSLRLAPLLAPNFSDLQVQEHTAAVPLRVIMDNYEETFNYATNKDGAILPHFSAVDYHSILRTMCANGLNPVGSLLDFLGYPVYADMFDSIQTLSILSQSLDMNLYSVKNLEHYGFFYDNEYEITMRFNYRGTDYSKVYTSFNDKNGFFFDIMVFVASRYMYKIGSDLYDSILSIYRDFGITPDDPSQRRLTIEEILPYSGYETVISLMNAYNAYLFGLMLEIYLDNKPIPADAPNYTSLPLRAYHRFHIDWNTNGNFVDRESELGIYVFDFERQLKSLIGSVNPNTAVVLSNFLMPKCRLWRNDFFTSQLPTSAVDNAIEIPANSTVLDLAKLTAFQKLVMKLSYSSRYRDVVWNIFKISPSDARLVQSSVISRRYHSVGIGETIQTSESTTSSVLGNFAGRGYSSGRNDSYHLLAEEPMIILNLFSLIPLATYADALHPNIHMDDIFDIPIPDMDVLGNQPIMADLISGNVSDSTSVFGFGRQYQEFLSSYDTVHGDFKTSLNYWQLSRRFDSTPYLNDEFLRMSNREDFDTIFSVPNASHAMVTVVYNNMVTRHVHRNVRILV